MPPENTSNQNQPISPAEAPPAPAMQQAAAASTSNQRVHHANPAAKPLAPRTKQNTPVKAVKPKANKKPENTSQKSLLISEIRDGMVIMRDGSMRAVVSCQSINFDLMNPKEREGVEHSYRGFLNSLYFPVQIFIRSQHINLADYMEKLEAVRRNQDNVLLSLLMEDYIAYVGYLVEAANIMDKKFYVVVPYYPSLAAKEGIASGAQKFSELFKPKQNDVVTIGEVEFKKYRQELTQQVRIVSSGLNQMGVNSAPLNTQELIELFYNVYNPVTAKQQPLTNVNELEAPIIGKGEGESKKIIPGSGI